MNTKLFAVTFREKKKGKREKRDDFRSANVELCGTLSMRALYCIRVWVGRKEKERREKKEN